jgi:hypothetical protein
MRAYTPQNTRNVEGKKVSRRRGGLWRLGEEGGIRKDLLWEYP